MVSPDLLHIVGLDLLGDILNIGLVTREDGKRSCYITFNWPYYSETYCF